MSAEKRTSLQCKLNCLTDFFHIRYLTKHEDLLFKFLMPTKWPVSGHESKLNFWSRANLYYSKEISYFTRCNTGILSTHSKSENLNYTTLKPNLLANMIYFFSYLKYIYWHSIKNVSKKALILLPNLVSTASCWIATKEQSNPTI